MAAYVGWNGYKYPGESKEGNGFKQGDTIETCVDLKRGTTEWRVNKKYQASVINYYLKNAEVVVPYLEMAHEGDIV